MKLESETILVTGGAGFLGSHLVDALITKNKVIILDDFSKGVINNIRHIRFHPNLKLVKGSIQDKAVIAKATKDVSVVFHLAAVVGVKHYVENPLRVIRTNVHGTDFLLEAALKHNVERFIFSSTSEIYGKNPRVPFKEESDRILGPPSVDRWSYSTSKAIGEHLCNAYFRQYKLPIVILRYFNVYGPRQETSEYGGVVSIFIHRVLKNQPPIVYGDGTQTRSFTYVSDSTEGTLLVATNKKAIGETFNLGTKHETSINDLANLVIRLAGKKGLKPVHLPYEEFYGPYYEDLKRRIPDTTKAEKLLGFKPKISLREGLLKTIKWYKAQL